MDIGAALRKAREGLTQEQIAEVLGCDQSTISGWETGKAQPSFEDVAAFETACHRPLGWVLRAAGLVEESDGVLAALEADTALPSRQAVAMLRAAYLSLIEPGAG